MMKMATCLCEFQGEVLFLARYTGKYILETTSPALFDAAQEMRRRFLSADGNKRW